MIRRILVIAAHPDDEIIGVGGTMVKRIKEGCEAHALILGEGISSRTEENPNEVIAKQSELYKHMDEAAKCIGYSTVECLKLPDNRLDQLTLLDVVHQIEGVIDKLKPDIIYTHYENDMNIDHQITYRAVLTATRPMRTCSVKEVYAFETMSSSEWYFGKPTFSPNVFVGIEMEMEQKISALKIYESEMRPFPHPRSLEGIIAMGQARGITMEAKYAEAFMLVRSIER